MYYVMMGKAVSDHKVEAQQHTLYRKTRALSMFLSNETIKHDW